MQPPAPTSPGPLQADVLAVRTRCATVAVVVDGASVAVLPTEAGRVRWRLPHDLFGRLLDVVCTASGRSVLPAPVDLLAHRRVVWLSWVRRGLAVGGHFAVDGPAAGPGLLPVPVALVSGETVYAQGFAVPGAPWRLSLARLPPAGSEVVLSPRVGALALDAALPVPADAFPILGHLDLDEGWGARGWVARRDDAAARLEVELWLDGRLAARARADRPRPDVAAAGLGDGHAGFDIPFPPGTRLDRKLLVEVRAAGFGLAGAPALRGAPPQLGRFDGMDGALAGGWVMETAAPDRPVLVEAVCDGEVVGQGRADQPRSDVAAAGLPHGRCGFQFALTAPTARLLGREVSVRAAGAAAPLPGSPSPIPEQALVRQFLARRDRVAPRTLPRLRRALTHRAGGTVLSLIMPVHAAPAAWLAEAVDSVRAQWSDAWELICVDDGAAAPEVLETAARADARIRVLRTAGGAGTAAAVNLGLEAARGELVAVLDHDDALEPDAVHHLCQAARLTGAGLIYGDEVVTGGGLDQLLELRARPAFSYDYYLSHPYFVHPVAVRTGLARAVGGWDARMAISADVDFVLRVLERTRTVAHVPRALYRWRSHPGSLGQRRRDEVAAATSDAIARHLGRTGAAGARVEPGARANQFRVEWPDDGGEVLAVIPSRDQAALLRRCVDSLERTIAGERLRLVVVDHGSSDPEARRLLRALGRRHTVMRYEGAFHFAAMNNRAVRAHAGAARYLLFLNNDVAATATGWLPRLRSLAGRAEVGAAGPMLLYEDGRVQHGGVLVGFDICAAHAMRFARPVDAYGRPAPGYNASLSSTRDFSAVTGACMMMRRSVFEEMGGFDEAFPIGYNDTDLCLRLRRAGYAVLYDGSTVLTHTESATRGDDPALGAPAADDDRLRARWPALFVRGDPFYSPLLSPAGRDHQLRADTPDPRRLAPRVQTCHIGAHAARRR